MENSTIGTVNDGVTFEEMAWEWLHMLRPQIKESTTARYMNILRIYLLPPFGSSAIGSIKRSEVLKFSRDMMVDGGARGKGLAPKSVCGILSVMKNIFDYAGKTVGIKVEDIRDIYIRQPRKMIRVLSRNEQTTLVGYLRNNTTPCKLGTLLCLFTGLRIGEICALRWGDICISERYLFVHQTIQRIQMPDDKGNKTKIIIEKPKSDCSVRRIPLPDDIIDILIPFRRADDVFVLTGSAQKFIEPRSMGNQFKAILKECGIVGATFHTLRHTFATRAIELGFDTKSLSEILGHASVNITLNRYVHPSMELKQENMNRLSVLLEL